MRPTTTPSEDTPTDTRVTNTPSDLYLRIHPTNKRLNPQAIESAFKRLHALLTKESPGLLDRLRGPQPPKPTLECLLTSDGTGSIEYVFSITPTEHQHALTRILRTLFPDTYELTHTQDPLQELLGTERETTENAGVSGLEFEAHVSRPQDWQTSLQPYAHFEEEDSRIPLASILEAMSDSDEPLVYQVILTPKPDWSSEAQARIGSLEVNQDTLTGQLTNTVFGSPPEDADLPQTIEERIRSIENRDPRHSFVLNARLLTKRSEEEQEGEGEEAHAHEGSERTGSAPQELSSVFASVSGPYHKLAASTHHETSGRTFQEAILNRGPREPSYGGLQSMLPGPSRSPGIIVDTKEIGNFLVVDGTRITQGGARALNRTPGERTSLPQPPIHALEEYQEGLPLGIPLTQDGTQEKEPVRLPHELQSLHLAWFGKTGSGKTTSLINGILENHESTEGASILIDPKGDGMSQDYLRAHYTKYGSLEDVTYFDCRDLLPAFSFFDIRPDLHAGIPRESAVDDKVEHYVEVLTQIMGKERFEQAVRSPDIIRYVLKACFDPVHGSDAFSHREFHEEIRKLHEDQHAPSVSDTDLERMLGGVVANRKRSFDELMAGVANRIDKIPLDRRLARIFNHTPNTTHKKRTHGDSEEPVFDLESCLDQDHVIIFDTGGLRNEAQRVLALVVLSNLWSALKRRQRHHQEVESRKPSQGGDDEQTEGADTERKLPLVNVYIEEAASIAVSDLLSELLAQSRGFGCSLTLAMQFPAQLQAENPRAYQEVLNNVSTIVMGNVPLDDALAKRLSTEDMSSREVANRLRALKRGQWLLNLPGRFDTPEPRPFLASSLPQPPSLEESEKDKETENSQARIKDEFEEVLEERQAWVQEHSGLELTQPSTPESEEDDDELRIKGSIGGLSPLALTTRMPRTVRYTEELGGLQCSECNTRYNASTEGMTRAIECCSRLDAVERDDVPITSLHLKLTREEIEKSEYSLRQLAFIQAVYNAQQLRYQSREYDLRYDSMIRLQEYTGIESSEIQGLIEDDVLTQSTDHPHRLYSVTHSGRTLIGESYRQGIDYGHGKGDLDETSEHVLMVLVLYEHIQREYAENPDSEVEIVIPYFDLDQLDNENQGEEGSSSNPFPADAFMGESSDAIRDAQDAYDRARLDVAGLDAQGEIVVVGEAERINNDTQRAVPHDYDKMAACNPQEAIWVVMKQHDGHKILNALNNPLDGTPRIEKTYAETTPPQQFRIQEKGLTQIYPLTHLRDKTHQQSHNTT